MVSRVPVLGLGLEDGLPHQLPDVGESEVSGEEEVERVLPSPHQLTGLW